MQRTGRTAIAFGVSLVLLVVTSLAVVPSADAGTGGDEQLFIQLINQLRSDKGLNPLVVDNELTAQARAWSQSMAANDQLAHTSNLAGGISSKWTVLGENVGVHVIHDVPGLFQAFVASPSHYQNLVDPRFQYIGVGVVNTGGGKLWTTHRFMAATPPPSPAPPTTAAPTTTPPAPAPAPPTTPAPPAPAATVPVQSTPTTAATSPDTVVSTTDRADPGRRAPGGVTGDPAGPTPADDGEDRTTTSTGGETSTSTVAPEEQADADRQAFAELVKPDAATIEKVLIALLAAGI